jgi:hypothetical protein
VQFMHTVEFPFKVLQFYECPHVTFSAVRAVISRVKYRPFKIFLNLMFESAASETNLKYGFHCVWFCSSAGLVTVHM